MAKKKGKVRLKQRAAVKKKGEGRDSLKKAPTRLAGDNAANFKIKVRRKQ